mgnify:FL=1
MAEFINPEDYNASIHKEILESIIREDEAVLEICEDQAIEQMKSYLGTRYDCRKIFSARGKERNALILMFAIDITLYHVCSIHNPQKFSPFRKERYERAMEWLKGVSRMEIGIPEAPALDSETVQRNMPTQIRSNPKRVTHR